MNRSSLVFLAVVFVANSLSQVCHGDVFFDRAEWDAAVCGNLIAEDFSSFNATVPGNFFVDNPATVAWGNIVAVDQEFVTAFNTEDGNSILAVDGQSLDLNIDGSHGAVEGFCVLYGPDQFTMTIYDVNTVITTIDVPADASPDGAYVCWTNSTAANVTRVRIDVALPSNLIAIASIDFSFGDGDCPGDPPTANAGTDQSIRAGDPVVLDGSASFDDDTDQESLDYAWSFVGKPIGSVASLDDATSVMPSFVADNEGIYTLQLVVTDEHGLSSVPDYVEISSDDNLAPTAVATGPNLVVLGDAVQFNGTDSLDPENDPLTYCWSIIAAPAGSIAALVGAETANPTLTPDIEGTYQVSLTVSDFLGPGAAADVEVTVTTASGFAETLILDASDQACALTGGQVTTKGNQTAFVKHLANAIKKLQQGDLAAAIDVLNKAIGRTDGCHLRGTPDGSGPGRDWITDCTAQTAIYDLLTAAVEALEN